jgi:3-oxoacyl-[acyl-carrier protein] reductase
MTVNLHPWSIEGQAGLLREFPMSIPRARSPSPRPRPRALTGNACATGRCALVTGAAQGIGAGIARRLAANGDRVALLDKDPAGLEGTRRDIEGAGGAALAVIVDLAAPAQVELAVTRIEETFGPPLVLVNNAGFARDAPLAEASVADWDDIHTVQLRAAYLLIRRLAPAMAAARFGRIVQISSLSARGHAERANYCAAKAGMHGLIRSLAVELGPSGITANAVAPGLIRTRMTEATARRRGLTLEAHLADAVSRVPARRAGTPEDIAAAVSYLASAEAGFVSGQVLYVSGGAAI